MYYVLCFTIKTPKTFYMLCVHCNKKLNHPHYDLISHRNYTNVVGFFLIMVLYFLDFRL